MAGKELENRIFVGGLGWDITERQLQDTFSRFGKIIDSQIMVERDTGRPRGFGFVTFADRRGMEDAIRDMHGREFGDRVISVNKAEPKLWSDDRDLGGHGHSGGYSSGGRGSYMGGDRSLGQDECFKCGRPGHWARDCPSSGGGRGGGQFSTRPKFGRSGGHGDRFGGDRDRYIDDRYDAGRYGDRDRYNGRDNRYGSRERYVPDRYPPNEDRITGDRYGGSDRYPPNGYGKERRYAKDGGPRGSGSSRGFDRDGGPSRGSGDRFGGGAEPPPSRYEGRSYRERPGPYDRPSSRRGGRTSYNQY